MRAKLLFLAPAPVFDEPSGYRLDVKFVEGMRAHVEGWKGPVHCVLWRGMGALPFGRSFQAQELGFDLTVLDHGQRVPDEVFGNADLAMASADLPRFPDFVQQARDRNVPVVASLEYTLETRLQIIRLDRALGMARRLRRSLSAYLNDYQMRRALRLVSCVQFNGYPAFDTYGGLVKRPLLYLDNRMNTDLMATRDERRARADRLLSGAPLRLIHSGRLEPMKGAQDLLPVMAALRARGVNATLDIFGTGSLEAEIRAGLPAFDGAVRLHGPVDFETDLVPFSRREADIYLSCHRQSDPSCTYVEAMGCGLAVAGYENRMWSRLAAEADLDAVAPLGHPEQLARIIADWDGDRASLIEAADKAFTFARGRDFSHEFEARMAHVQACATCGKGLSSD